LNHHHILNIESVGLRSILDRAHRLDWALAVPVGLSVTLGLLGARLALRVPTPLSLFLGGTFAVWSLAFWAALRGGRGGVYRRVAQWLAPWLVAVGLILGAVQRVDRAGWLWYRLTGYDAVWPEAPGDRAGWSAARFLAHYPTFAPDPADPARVTLPPGPHDFGETVVVPRGVGLTIAPGAVLRFGAGRSLVAYGPVTARGTAERPIVFTARNAGPSVFAHVRFEHARYAQVDGELFTGALSLHRTDAEIAHGAFGPLFGKDAIYVRDAKVDIHDNVVRDAFKDGLDIDGGRGTVRHNRFIDCGDEGIDLSGDLDVEVVDNVVLDARGGRIAAERGLAAILAANRLGYAGSE